MPGAIGKQNLELFEDSPAKPKCKYDFSALSRVKIGVKAQARLDPRRHGDQLQKILDAFSVVTRESEKRSRFDPG